MDPRWEPNYRVTRLKSLWTVLVENQISGKTKCCNIGDLKAKHPSEDWMLQPSPIGRTARFINYPDNLPDVTYQSTMTWCQMYRRVQESGWIPDII